MKCEIIGAIGVFLAESCIYLLKLGLRNMGGYFLSRRPMVIVLQTFPMQLVLGGL